MPAAWPATLPQNPYAVDGAQYRRPFNAVRTEMDAGPAKHRRRYTAVPSRLSCTLHLSKAQWATLETFYSTTLATVLPFTWVDFRTGAAANYRFVDAPAETYLGGDGDFWTVELQLERLP
jgi:hypothetical protein